jgi:hypothetical protein
LAERWPGFATPITGLSGIVLLGEQLEAHCNASRMTLTGVNGLWVSDINLYTTEE